ncbi:MAG: hypothetical protein JXA04_11050 [Gammaproteobacteria bacterium]|nr:hypothetical protein [Gammaproteobacteria bacterium]
MPLVLYTQISENNCNRDDWGLKFDNLLPLLPEARQIKLRRIRNVQTRITSILGLLLLRQGMRKIGFQDFSLQELIYSENNKPYCPDRYDFNISHSHSLVLCAFSADSRIGVDAERIRDIKPERFGQLLAFADKGSVDLSTQKFFELWTKKEAVIKADGKGGVWDMGKVELNGNKALLHNKQWNLVPVKMPTGYIAHLAHDAVTELHSIEPTFLCSDRLLSDALMEKSL